MGGVVEGDDNLGHSGVPPLEDAGPDASIEVDELGAREWGGVGDDVRRGKHGGLGQDGDLVQRAKRRGGGQKPPGGEMKGCRDVSGYGVPQGR